MAEALVPIFRVENGHAAAAWYAQLGFELIGEHRFGEGFPLYAFLRRGDAHLHLSEHEGDAPPRGLAYLYVEDVAPIAERMGVALREQPWGPEIEVVDLDGNRLRIGAPHRRG